MMFKVTCEVDNRELLRSTRENMHLLSLCTGHEFEPVTERKIQYKCQRCGGSLDLRSVVIYNQGRAHGFTERTTQQMRNKAA